MESKGAMESMGAMEAMESMESKGARGTMGEAGWMGLSGETDGWPDVHIPAEFLEHSDDEFDPEDPAYNYMVFSKQVKEKKQRRKMKKILGLFNDDLPTDRLAVEELKEAGNWLYMEKDYESALEFYTKAILLFESRFYENCPRDQHSKCVLGVLYGNRCQCFLMLAKNAQGGEFFDPHRVSPDVRYYALRGSRDAVMSYTLDPLNAKSHHKRGQALLLLSSLQQRSKEAVKCFERALQLGTLPEATKKESLLWLHYAKQRCDEETPLPVAFSNGGCSMQ